jgi:hypothetical protein
MARGVRHNRFYDPAIADCLLNVVEPEIGLSIIDLGLVYHASLNADGVDVMMTLTTRNGPLRKAIVGDARERLARAAELRTKGTEQNGGPPNRNTGTLGCVDGHSISQRHPSRANDRRGIGPRLRMPVEARWSLTAVPIP